MATDVNYNGVVLHNVTTRQWDQEAVYDASGSDLIGMRYNLQFECIVHSAYQGSDSPAWTGLGTAGAAEIPFSSTVNCMKSFRSRLAQPRGDLLVTMGGEPLLEVKPATNPHTLRETADIDSGPKPQVLSITHVAGNKVFRIVWSVQCQLRECAGISSANLPVVSNRWSMAETMEDNTFITRSIQGRLRLSTASMLVAHCFKGLVLPMLEAGFRRARIHYQVEPDALEATYQIVDKQVHTAAPAPAILMDCRYSESAAQMGILWHSTCMVRLSGPPAANKRLMLARAFQVIEARLQINTPEPLPAGEEPVESVGQNATYIPVHAEIVEHIGEGNTVEAKLTILRLNPTKHMQALVRETYGQPLKLPDLDGLSYESLESLNPPAWGYQGDGKQRTAEALLAHLHCALKGPCTPLSQHKIGAPVQTEISAEISEPGRGDKLTAPDDADFISPGEWTNVATDARSHIYTVSSMSSKYTSDPLRVALPIMGGGEGGDDATVVIPLARPQCTREITIEAERVGTWPKIPTPVDSYEDGALRGRLMRHEVTPQAPFLDAFGDKRIYKLSAKYVYAMNRPPTLEEKVRVGVLPYTDFDISQTQFDPSLAYSVKELA